MNSTVFFPNIRAPSNAPPFVIAHTRLLPDGTYPIRELTQLLTYQAIID
jgi:hypothetical protein